MTKEEQVNRLKVALIEQYRWFSGKNMEEGIALDVATRLYELGWRLEE